MKRFTILAKAILLMSLRNGAVLFWNFAFPALLMLIYGVIMPQYMDYMTAGVVVLNALSFGIVGSSTMMLEMREKGVLRRLQATPLPAGQLLLAYLLVNLLITLLQSALIVGLGVGLYQVSVSIIGLALSVPMILAGVLTFLAMGQIIGGIAPKTGVATAAGMAVYFSLMFVSDMVFPLQMLPDWLKEIVPYLPTYAVAQLVRRPLLEGTLDPNWLTYILLLAIYGTGSALVAARLFRWEPRA